MRFTISFFLSLPDPKFSIENVFCLDCISISLSLDSRADATSLTFFSSFVEIRLSATFGVPDSPVITTGIPGPADAISLLSSSYIALTLPNSFPTNI